MEPRIEDWGHVLAIHVDGYGASDAMSKAGGAAVLAGYRPVRAIRASLRSDNPDPAEFPSEFEVLVQVKE